MLCAAITQVVTVYRGDYDIAQTHIGDSLRQLCGSFASGATGRPCATSQNGQRRVQIAPRIIKVAVPWLKHSARFGQEASSHRVQAVLTHRCFDSGYGTSLPEV